MPTKLVLMSSNQLKFVLFLLFLTSLLFLSNGTSFASPSCWEVTGWTGYDVGDTATVIPANCTGTPAGSGWFFLESEIYILTEETDPALAWDIRLDGYTASGEPIPMQDLIVCGGCTTGTDVTPEPPVDIRCDADSQLAPTDGNGVFCIDSNGKLMRKYIEGNRWVAEVIAGSWGSLDLDSLITGQKAGVHSNVYGLTSNGTLFTTWNNGGTITFGTISQAPKQASGSLAFTDGNGVFGIRKSDGKLSRSYWSGGWNNETIAGSWSGLNAEALIPGRLDGVNANVYGLTSSGKLFNTWNNNGTITFGTIPTNNLVGTIAYDPGSNVFGVNTTGNLIHSYWSSGWQSSNLYQNYTYGAYVTTSLTSGFDNNVFGLLNSGKMIVMDNSNGYTPFVIH